MKTTEQFISDAIKIHGNKYDYSVSEYTGALNKLKIKCLKCGNIFLQKPNDHLNNHGCPFCAKNDLKKPKLNTQQFIEKAKKVHNNFYDYSLVDYKGTLVKVKIICPIHGEFEQKPNYHLSGNGCPICSGKTKKTTFQFIQEAKLVHNDFYDYSLSDYTNNKTKVKIICPKHGVFEQSPIEHLRGRGCPKCSGKNKTTQEFIQEAISIFGDRYDYSLTEYKNTNSKIKIICPNHGIFEITPHDHLGGLSGCPKCSGSNPEKIICSYFQEKNIEYEFQKIFSNCRDKKPLPFDFYIPSKNLLIEYNGIQHYQEFGFFGGRKKFLLQKHHDWLKRKYCRKNNIDLLVIKFDENIISRLNSLD